MATDGRSSVSTLFSNDWNMRDDEQIAASARAPRPDAVSDDSRLDRPDPAPARVCFSATVSLTAGAALLVVGAVTTKLAARPAEIPFALIPALFGIQQLLEGALWLTFPDKAPMLNIILTHAYSVFSHVIWPIYVPIAVLLLEPVAWRRKVLVVIAILGAVVGLYLLYFLLGLPIVAKVVGQHISYISPHFYVVAVMVLYVLGTCVSSLVSSHGWVRLFGVAALVSFGAAAAFYAAWFISVWCFFAAVMSGIVVMFFLRPQVPGSDGPGFLRLVQ